MSDTPKPTTSPNYRLAIMQQLANINTTDLKKLNKLVATLTAGDDENAKLETMYGYLTGQADWKKDYEQLYPN